MISKCWAQIDDRFPFPTDAEARAAVSGWQLLPIAIISYLPLLEQVSQHVEQFGIVDRSDPTCWQDQFVFPILWVNSLFRGLQWAAKDATVFLEMSVMMSIHWRPETSLQNTICKLPSTWRNGKWKIRAPPLTTSAEMCYTGGIGLPCLIQNEIWFRRTCLNNAPWAKPFIIQVFIYNSSKIAIGWAKKFI